MKNEILVEIVMVLSPSSEDIIWILPSHFFLLLVAKQQISFKLMVDTIINRHEHTYTLKCTPVSLIVNTCVLVCKYTH